MLTASEERFQKIQEEAPPEYQQYLVRVTECRSALHCKVSEFGQANSGRLRARLIWSEVFGPTKCE